MSIRQKLDADRWVGCPFGYTNKRWIKCLKSFIKNNKDDSVTVLRCSAKITHAHERLNKSKYKEKIRL